MFDDNEGPKDWELKDEEPPETLRKKWEQDESPDRGRVVCPACKKETPWYARTATLVISFLTVGPFALPLVWFNPAYSRRKKIIVTVIVLALTYALAAVFLHAAGTILDYYKQAGIF